MLRRIAYFVGKALGSVRESPGISILTSATVGAALVVVGFYVMALQNLEGLALIWGRAATMSAFVDDALDSANHEALRKQITLVEAVDRAILVSPKEALERFRARGPEAAALVAGVSETVLPTTIELHLKGGFADLKALEDLAGEVAHVPGITSVDYGQAEFERLAALLELLRYGGLLAGLLIALATAFIVSNTIRLTVYARRDEIEILMLVGATRWFVRTPFLFEGALWGFGGGIAAAATMSLADLFLAPRIAVAIADVVGGLDVHLFTSSVAGGLILGGVGLGVLGSTLAVSRFLDMETH